MGNLKFKNIIIIIGIIVTLIVSIIIIDNIKKSYKVQSQTFITNNDAIISLSWGATYKHNIIYPKKIKEQREKEIIDMCDLLLQVSYGHKNINEILYIYKNETLITEYDMVYLNMVGVDTMYINDKLLLYYIK